MYPNDFKMRIVKTKMEDAHIHTKLNDQEIDIKWIRGNSEIIFDIPESWRYFGKCRNKISANNAEDTFWSLITLFHLMSTRWIEQTDFDPNEKIYLTKPNEKNAFTLFVGWEMELNLNGHVYWLKLKLTPSKLPKIYIWTNSDNQSRYIQEFIPNIVNIPSAVRYIIDTTLRPFHSTSDQVGTAGNEVCGTRASESTPKNTTYSFENVINKMVPRVVFISAFGYGMFHM